jgi:alpha-D-xyloside xylohydrolase
MPYLWSQAINTATTGYPMLRSMVLEFSDPACRFIDTQYMLGENLLVAPVFSEEGKVTYYLPKGNWINLLTGEGKAGGTYYEEICDYFHLPLYGRPNTIIAMSKNNQEVAYDYAKEVTLHVMPLEDGKSADCVIYDEEQRLTLDVKILREKDTYQITIEKMVYPCAILFRTLHTLVECKSPVELVSEGILMNVKEQNQEIILVAKE